MQDDSSAETPSARDVDMPWSQSLRHAPPDHAQARSYPTDTNCLGYRGRIASVVMQGRLLKKVQNVTLKHVMFLACSTVFKKIRQE